MNTQMTAKAEELIGFDDPLSLDEDPAEAETAMDGFLVAEVTDERK